MKSRFRHRTDLTNIWYLRTQLMNTNHGTAPWIGLFQTHNSREVQGTFYTNLGTGGMVTLSLHEGNEQTDFQ